MEGHLRIKLKYPVKKYFLPWSFLILNIATVFRLGNLVFIVFVAITSSIFYLFFAGELAVDCGKKI